MDKQTLPFKLDRSSFGKLDRGTWSVASIDVTVF